MPSQNLNNNIKKISIAIFTLMVLGISMLSVPTLISPQKTKLADASGPNSSNLIIGKTDIGSSVELSVCVQATPGPIHLANASTWFQFDTLSLSPTANTFIQKGQYGNSNNGYGALKWQEVAGTQNGSLNAYSMSLVYSGDGVTPGLAGLPMATTPELFGKVSFTKVSGSTASSSINLIKNIFYSTENSTAAINQTVSYVNGDCRTSNNVIIVSSSSSLSPNSTINTVSSATQINSQSSSSSINSLSTPSVNIVLTPNTQVPNISIPNIIFGQVFPSNGVPATFKFPGSNTSILGTIQNNTFVPNAGQIVPTDALAFYGANSFGNGLLLVGSQTYNIPTNVVNSSYIPFTGGTGGGSTPSTGGSITISIAQSSQTSKSSVIAQQALATTPQANIEAKNSGIFKSKLNISDPFVCGVGSFGNVLNAKEFGVENVFYDFYKVGSNIASYSFKLKLNSNGDFFLPISNVSNKIIEGNYKVVYYALDNEGNKAQGEYTDLITDNCANKTKVSNQANLDVNSVRTGGLDIHALTTIVLFICSLAILAIYKNKKVNIQIVSRNK